MKYSILVFMLLLLLTSCSSVTSGTVESTTVVSANISTEEKVKTIDVENMNGETFTFYIRWKIDGWDWNVNDLCADEQNGEPINDAVFKRNGTIMELYNCVIEQEKSNSATGNSDIKNIILSGDDTYEALIMSGRDMTALGQEGMLYNLFELDNIDPYMDYWNPTLTESLTCGNKLYYAMGDLSATDNRAVRCLYFNKDLFELNKLENPYELVKSGKWTHERFFEMMNVGLADLNGDSIYDDNDRFGLFVQPTIGLNLFYSSGNKFVSKDSKDLFVTVFNTKKVLDTMTIVSDRIKNASEQIVMSNDYQKYIRLFAENHSLFYSEVSIFIEHFRQYEFNVGMLPMPKYDENQENYYQFADGYCLNFVGIPVTNKNPEKVALILEALSYESLQTLTPAYYEICLTGKAIRDEESKEMLDIIFNSYIVDYADLFNINFFDDFSKALRGETEIASTLQNASESAKTLVDEINQKYK